MMRKLIFTVLAVIPLVSTANASTITFSLVPGPGGPGTFALTASTSAGDNFGLDYYAVTLNGAATISHVGVSPKILDADEGLTYGFGFARSADTQKVVSAAQDSTGGGVAVYGMGQIAGNLKSLVPAGDATAAGRPDSVGTYGVPLVLATGTYLNNIPPTIGTTAGFVFTSQGNGGTFGKFAAPTSIIINQLPEPASIALVGWGLIVGLGYRRRSSSHSMMRKTLLAGLAAISMASVANASTITYSLVPGPGGPGTFALTASASSGDNFGIEFYDLKLSGAATIQHANVSPKLVDLDSGLSYGFTLARSNDSDPTVVTGQQDHTGEGVPVYGIGQTAGTLQSLVPAGDAFAGGRPDSIGTYGATLLLATGTYLNNIPPKIVVPFVLGDVFTSQGAGGAFGSFGSPNSIVVNQFPTPEPASIALGGLCVVGCLGLRSRK